MLYYQLKAVTAYFQKFKKLHSIYRIDDTLFCIEFEPYEQIFFDMQKMQSTIYKRDDFNKQKNYQAPFDIVLKKRCHNAKIDNIELFENDKVILFTLTSQILYKTESIKIQFEFTGKNTNVILVNQDGIVLEALRHITKSQSIRSVTVGVRLDPLPPFDFKPKEIIVKDVEQFLYDNYNLKNKDQLEQIKKQKIGFLKQKIKTLNKHLNLLPSIKSLEDNIEYYYHIANLILSQLHTIKPYNTKLTLNDYDGSKIDITLDKLFKNPHQISDYYFKLAKKFKQKKEHRYIQYQSLTDKKTFFEDTLYIVENAKNKDEITILFPTKKLTKKEDNKKKYTIFWIDNYKVMLGKNQSATQELLKDAKANHIWLHMQGIRSAHVVVATDKKQLPQHVLYQAAKLCVDYTTHQIGDFLVDYTQRKEVKIQDGTNVLYNKYQTISITKN